MLDLNGFTKVTNGRSKVGDLITLEITKVIVNGQRYFPGQPIGFYNLFGFTVYRKPLGNKVISKSSHNKRKRVTARKALR